MRNLLTLPLLCIALLLSSFCPPKEQYQVYIFLAPKCPICRDYSLKLKMLHEAYSEDGFEFEGVFPNDHSSQEEISAFQDKYQLPFPLTKGDKTLARKLGASVTPEAFVLNHEGDILYSGRIDNTFFRVGRRRTNTTTNDLEDAIIAITNQEPIVEPKTEAVGCIIEY